MTWTIEVFETSLGQPGIRIVDSYGTTVADNEPYYPQKLRAEHAEIIVSAMNEVAELREQLANALDRINDMLEGDDAQAWDEARKFVSGLTP